VPRSVEGSGNMGVLSSVSPTLLPMTLAPYFFGESSATPLPES